MDRLAEVSMRQRFVRWLEQTCHLLDSFPAWFRDEEGVHYHPLGDVWKHPLASWSQSLDAKWHTGIWQVKEAS